MADDYDDIIDKLKKMFNLNSKLFDMDFYIFPDSDLGKKLGLDDLDESKGIRISYHFEPGMKEPDVKIDSDVDKDKLKDYLRKMNIENRPDLQKFIQSRSNSTEKPNKKFIDATQLSLESSEGKKEREPLAEVHDYADYTEIILEVPGIKENDIEVSVTDDGKRFEFCGESDNCKYIKIIPLTFKITDPEFSINVNNGLAIIKIK
ncbi:MAG: hypothetical protein EU521_01245 [Promethearchaeota archaeon]|nr:MAG: hypothetical protein EU521_01245 [Candidatus Lokiarchaeota archaeon]